MSRQLDDVLALLDATLGDAVIAAYLFGSAVDGGLRPDSDLDLLVLARRSATAEERRALVSGLLPISGRDRRAPGDRYLEVTVVVQADVRPWRYPPLIDLQYGDWLRGEFEAGALPERHARPDLAVLLTMVLARGHALRGPAATEVLDPVPHGDLRRAIVDEVPGLLGDLDTDTRNVLLTLARAWLTLATGDIGSKDAAADFAIGRLPAEHRRPMVHARAIYVGEAEERWDDDVAARVRPCADAIVTEIGRVAASWHEGDSPLQPG